MNLRRRTAADELFAFKTSLSSMATAAERLDTLLRQPPIHRGLSELDRDRFAQTIDLLAVAVPSSRVSEALQVLKGCLYSY